MELTVTRGVIDRLHAEAARTSPEECCGVLLGREGHIDAVVPAANVADDRLRRFEIDPLALLAAHRAAREGGPKVLGYYHSHPEGHPVPSATDCEHSTGDLRIWAIIADATVAFWRDSGDGFDQLAVRIVA